jgi:hypothetical protein
MLPQKHAVLRILQGAAIDLTSQAKGGSNMKQGIAPAVASLLLVLSAGMTFAQGVPMIINYQGYLLSDGQPYSAENVQIMFSIYGVSTGGTSLWTETQAVTVTDGFYNALLGSQISFPDGLFSGDDRYLGIKVGSEEEMIPRIRIASVGFAINADMVDGLDASAFLSIDSDYGRVGVSADLYEGSTTLGDKYLGIDAKASDSEMLDGLDSSEFLSTLSDYGRSGVASDLYEGTTNLSDKYLGLGAKAADSDKLDGLDSSEFLSTTNDYGRPGVAVDLYESTTKLSDKYVGDDDLDHLDAADGSPTNAVYVNNSGYVGIGTTSPAEKLHIAGDVRLNSGGDIAFGDDYTMIYESSDDLLVTADDDIYLRPDDDVYVQQDGGSSWVRFDTGSQSVGIGTTSPSLTMDVVGTIGNRSTSSSGELVLIWCTTGGAGWLGTYGVNGNRNVALSNLLDYSNHGYLSVRDANDQYPAAMYVNSYGQGVVFADTKNFRTANPAEPGTEIWYACIEGPEAAAYVRGTGHLVDGEAVVTLPEHFGNVVSSQGITAQVTPLSPESRGLAVVEKRPDRLVIRELQNGTGTYDFDYLAMAVRKGYENYRVIRPTSEAMPAMAQEISQPEETD